MSTLFKDLYNETFLDYWASKVVKFHPHFRAKSFVKETLSADWPELELKGRMRRITEKLYKHLSGDYQQDLQIISAAIDEVKSDQPDLVGIEFMFVPDYIEMHGLEHYDISVEALGKFTSFVSSEFAVRPFIIKYGDRMMDQMMDWSKSDDLHRRRLASEGCRPRLPWAIALPEFKKDPSPVLPILEQLKEDESEYVRRSVANNLNDISKDHPDLVLDIAKQWMKLGTDSQKLVKHAMRTLLKSNHPGALPLIGYSDPKHLDIKAPKVKNDQLKIGDHLQFNFQLINKNTNNSKVRLEYAIYYLMKNGSHSRKVFKISEREMAQGEELVEKKHHLKPITTRTYYPGQHFIGIIVNGVEREKLAFDFT